MRAEARGGGAWEAILCPLTLVGVVLAAYRPLLDHDGGWGLTQEWDDRNNFLENDLVRRPLRDEPREQPEQAPRRGVVASGRHAAKTNF